VPGGAKSLSSVLSKKLVVARHLSEAFREIQSFLYNDRERIFKKTLTKYLALL
jgi:hypothetical protein